jgi:hypothetical protein
MLEVWPSQEGRSDRDLLLGIWHRSEGHPKSWSWDNRLLLIQVGEWVDTNRCGAGDQPALLHTPGAPMFSARKRKMQHWLPGCRNPSFWRQGCDRSGATLVNPAISMMRNARFLTTLHIRPMALYGGIFYRLVSNIQIPAISSDLYKWNRWFQICDILPATMYLWLIFTLYTAQRTQKMVESWQHIRIKVSQLWLTIYFYLFFGTIETRSLQKEKRTNTPQQLRECPERGGEERSPPTNEQRD